MKRIWPRTRPSRRSCRRIRRSCRTPRYYLEHVDYDSGTRVSPKTLPREPMQVWQRHDAGFAIIVGLRDLAGASSGSSRRSSTTAAGTGRPGSRPRCTRSPRPVHVERGSDGLHADAARTTVPGVGADPVEGPVTPIAAPLSRILWSLQAGVVLAMAGFGLLFVSGRAYRRIAQPLFASACSSWRSASGSSSPPPPRICSRATWVSSTDRRAESCQLPAAGFQLPHSICGDF